MSTAATDGAAEVQRLVQDALNKQQPRDYRLDARAAEKFEEDWWRVCVRPDRDGVRADDYARILTEVEERLRDQHGLNIVLVPVLV